MFCTINVTRGESVFCTVGVSISSGAGTCASAARNGRWRVFHNFNNFDIRVWLVVGHSHAVEAVLVCDVLVVEPGAIAGLPRRCADHAKLSCTAASHMIAALFQLNNSLAAVATLPALCLRHLFKTVRLIVLWAFPLRVKFVITKYAYFSRARCTPCVLPVGDRVHADLRGLDPLATSFGRAVQTVGSGVLLIFPIPEVLEFVVE
jgi:hypothetical protein